MVPDFSPSIILRSYLDAGGRIVWMGNIPFWLQGKDKRRIKEGEQSWVEWRFYGIFSILGLNAEFNYSPQDRVAITDEGETWKLRKENRWYGTRPIREGKESVKVLAESSANKFALPELLEVEEKKPPLINYFSKFFSLLDTLSSIIKFVLMIIAALSSLIYLTVQSELIWLINAIVIGSIFCYSLIRTRTIKLKKYANAWIKNFNPSFPDSGFVRIWDCQLYDVTKSMLEDLFAVATHDKYDSC